MEQMTSDLERKKSDRRSGRRDFKSITADHNKTKLFAGIME